MFSLVDVCCVTTSSFYQGAVFLKRMTALIFV
jgi:hypothetical protein